jgi:glycosyltransferase involved in cell wall biosynthesis
LDTPDVHEPKSEIRKKGQKPKLALARGGLRSHGIGMTDWRITLFLSREDFETWILVTDDAAMPALEGIHVVQIPAPIRLPILYTIATALLAGRRLLGLRPDVFVCQPGFALAGMICGLACPKTKIVLDVRTIPVESSGLLGLVSRAWFEVALRLPWFDAITVITEGMLDLLDAEYHLRQRVPTAVWGSGFDEEIFLSTVDGSTMRQNLGLQASFVVMFHGTFSKTRGLEEAMQSLRLLRDRGVEDVVLVLIGGGAAEAHLRRVAKELDIADQVCIKPPVAHTEIPRWIAAADLGLDPLPDHPWWHYQSPLKVYEYLAMGKPVLATDIPCHRGISEAVILVPDNAPSTLADSILRMKDLPAQERHRLGEIAQQDSRHHTWAVKAKVLTDFIYGHVLHPE